MKILLVIFFLIIGCTKKNGTAPSEGELPSTNPETPPSEVVPAPPAVVLLPGSNIGIQPSWVPQFSNIVLSNSLQTSSAISNGAVLISAVGTNAVINDLNLSNINPALGTSGGGLIFDGVDDSVSFGDSSAYQITSDITISMWYRKNSESSDWSRLIGKGDSTNRNYGIWEHPGVGRNLLVQIYCVSSVCLNMNSVGLIDVGIWYHISMVRSGSSISLYINGVLDSTSTLSGIPKTSTDPLTVGWSFHGFQNMSAGETTIWNTGLSASEVLTVFNYQKSAFGL